MNLNVIVIATGDLADAFVRAAEMVVDPHPNLHALSCNEGGNMVETGNAMADMIQKSGAEFTIILSDAYGSTPTGAALLAISKCENAAVVTGVNLVSIIQALELGKISENAHMLLESIERDGREGIRTITRDDVWDTRG